MNYKHSLFIWKFKENVHENQYFLQMMYTMIQIYITVVVSHIFCNAGMLQWDFFSYSFWKLNSERTATNNIKDCKYFIVIIKNVRFAHIGKISSQLFFINIIFVE